MIYRFGMGTVVVHPDITVRNQSNYQKGGGAIPKFWQDGYHWGGISLQGVLHKMFMLSRNTYFSVETKLVYAKTDVPIANGSVEVVNQSAHVIAGFGGFF